MSYEFYLLLHFIGVFMVVTSLGAMTLHMINGGTRALFPARKWAALWHGVGLFVVFIAGFGLMAKLGIGHDGLPGWILVKLTVWLILGGLPVLVYRQAKMAKALWILIFVLAGLAAAMAIYKPGAHPGNGPMSLIAPPPTGAPNQLLLPPMPSMPSMPPPMPLPPSRLAPPSMPNRPPPQHGH